MAKIRTGDCVQLKHNGGGLKMTVNEIRQLAHGVVLQCKWFNQKENKFETETFALGQ
jgi:uncharacterized protein YodC (DUF2158 family)